MRALSGVVSDRLFAVRALTRIGSRRRRSWHKTIDLLNQDENRRGNNDEVKANVEERAVSNDGRTSLLSGGEGFIFYARKVDIKVGKVHFAEQETERRHKNIGCERGNDFTERRADDYARCHVDYVTSENKFFPFR